MSQLELLVQTQQLTLLLGDYTLRARLVMNAMLVLVLLPLSLPPLLLLRHAQDASQDASQGDS